MGLDNPIHIAFVLILLLLVFGAKRLPEMGRSLGDGMRGFKDALSGHAGVSATDTTPHSQVSQVPHALASPSQPATAAPGVGAMQPATAAPGVAVMQPATAAPGVAVMQPRSPVAGVQTTPRQPLVERPPAA
jgi:sec-independent protein translocase protein TatA